MPSMPYGVKPIVFDAPGGQATVVTLSMPPRGVIHGIRLVQLSGTDVAATFELFQAAAAASADDGTSSESASEQLPASLYTVTGPLTKTAGVDYLDLAHHFPYTNMDGTATNPQRCLYLRITPAGAQAVTWAISLQLILPLTV